MPHATPSNTTTRWKVEYRAVRPDQYVMCTENDAHLTLAQAEQLQREHNALIDEPVKSVALAFKEIDALRKQNAAMVNAIDDAIVFLDGERIGQDQADMVAQLKAALRLAKGGV